ncbi:hypothetical protein [Chitinimonas taiwanensis]
MGSWKARAITNWADLGGFRVNFSSRNRSGSSFVDLTILDGSGKIRS